MTALNQIQFLIVSVDDHKLALRLSLVEQVYSAVEITPLYDAPETVLGLINVHGAIIVALNLRKKLNLRERDMELSDQLVIANSEDRQFALLVDEVQGIIQIPADRISAVSSEGEPDRQVINSEHESILIHELTDFLSATEEAKLRSALHLDDD